MTTGGFFDRLPLIADRTMALVYAVMVSNIVVYLVCVCCEAAPWLVLDASAVASRPWSVLTYAFVQGGWIHLSVNMLCLYACGRLLHTRLSPWRFASLYTVGIAGGAVAFMTYCCWVADGACGVLLGASAGVLCMAVAAAVITPDRLVCLPLVGEVRLKWVIGVAVALSCVGLAAPNVGGNVAHLGGVVAGALGARWCSLLSAARPPRRERDEYDALAAKIRQSGYNSLSKDEQRRFFQLSARKH